MPDDPLVEALSRALIDAVGYLALSNASVDRDSAVRALEDFSPSLSEPRSHQRERLVKLFAQLMTSYEVRWDYLAGFERRAEPTAARSSRERFRHRLTMTGDPIPYLAILCVSVATVGTRRVMPYDPRKVTPAPPRYQPADVAPGEEQGPVFDDDNPPTWKDLLKAAHKARKGLKKLQP